MEDMSPHPIPSSLDRQNLNIFVFGPGKGEAMAIALPDAGWILVDGCRVTIDREEHFPALECYECLRNGPHDPLELVVWTHPHDDHYHGIREAIDRYLPRHIGIALVEEPEPGSIHAELASLGTHPSLPHDVKLEDTFNRVRTTFDRIAYHWAENPDSRWAASSDALPLSLGSVTVQALSPDRADLIDLYCLPSPDLRQALRSRANEFGIVLELAFGDSRLLLGADMPHANAGRVLPHGWSRIQERHPGSLSPHLFKVSHHGSAEAIPPRLFSCAPEGPWAITPFAQHHLPNPEDGAKGGMKQLLLRQGRLELTSAPGLSDPSSHGSTVTRGKLRDALQAKRAGLFQGGITIPPCGSIYDCAWGFRIDPRGGILERYAGTRALTVVEA